MAEIINLKLEYKYIPIDYNEDAGSINDRLNIEGNDGWELVQFLSLIPKSVAVMKKAVVDTKEVLGNQIGIKIPNVPKETFETNGVDKMKFKVE